MRICIINYLTRLIWVFHPVSPVTKITKSLCKLLTKSTTPLRSIVKHSRSCVWTRLKPLRLVAMTTIAHPIWRSCSSNAKDCPTSLSKKLTCLRSSRRSLRHSRGKKLTSKMVKPPRRNWLSYRRKWSPRKPRWMFSRKSLRKKMLISRCLRQFRKVCTLITQLPLKRCAIKSQARV